MSARVICTDCGEELAEYNILGGGTGYTHGGGVHLHVAKPVVQFAGIDAFFEHVFGPSDTQWTQVRGTVTP